jgi:para-nitrobenzyl esterase
MRCAPAGLACLLACLLAAALPVRAEAPVRVTGGQIAGSVTNGIRNFRGVPFAAPPVGALRWRPPQPVVPWRGVRETTAFAPACAQTATWIPNPQSEDCLYLNIWAPQQGGKLPVIVWIHGGGLYGGTGAQPLYDGANLARRGVIVVTINYRLGVFGFFSHPQLSAQSPDKTSGNQGIEDQIAALHWVKRNIAAFGGDPERITIMGESAGAESVAILCASPLAKGLFQRAIAESGNDAMPLDPDEDAQFSRADAEAQGLAFASAAGAPDLKALRALGTADLLKTPWTPRTILDGHVVRADLITIYRQHRQNDVPLLLGWNAEEGKDLAPEILGTDAFTAADFPALAAKLLGHAPSEALLAAYPHATDAQAKAAIDRLTNDWWGWRMTAWAQLQAQNGRARPYVYYFTHRPAEPATPCGYGCGAGHGAEIQYVFDNLAWDSRAWSAADRALARDLADRWATFARGGDPNTAGLPAWRSFDGSDATIFRIGGADEIAARGAAPDFTLLTTP